MGIVPYRCRGIVQGGRGKSSLYDRRHCRPLPVLQCRRIFGTFANSKRVRAVWQLCRSRAIFTARRKLARGNVQGRREKSSLYDRRHCRLLPVSQWRNWREGSGGIILPISFFVVDRQPQVLQGQNLLVGQLRSCGVGAGGKTLFAGGRLNSIWQITYLRSSAFGFAYTPLTMEWKRCGEMSKRELFLFAEISIPKYNDNHCR